jgi:hypothetical protein
MNEEACCAISAPAAAAHDHCSWCTGRLLLLTLETAYLFLSKTTVDGQNVIWVLGAVLQHFVVLMWPRTATGRRMVVLI